MNATVNVWTYPNGVIMSGKTRMNLHYWLQNLVDSDELIATSVKLKNFRLVEVGEKYSRSLYVIWPYIITVNIGGDYYLLQRCSHAIQTTESVLHLRDFQRRSLVKLTNHLPSALTCEVSTCKTEKRRALDAATTKVVIFTIHALFYRIILVFLVLELWSFIFREYIICVKFLKKFMNKMYEKKKHFIYII